MKCLYHKCNNPLYRGIKYCSTACQAKHKRDVYILAWKEGKLPGGNIWGISDHVRHYLLEKANYACEKCFWSKKNPYTNKFPLEISHINGNWQDNREENLEVLCPNCHSLTDSYRALNKGRGRHSLFVEMNATVYRKQGIK